jgi:hypothetical protein
MAITDTEPEPEPVESEPRASEPAASENGADDAEPAATAGTEGPADDDRWERFAAEGDRPDQPPAGRLRRAARRTRRALTGEWAFAILFGCGLAVAMTWPVALESGSAIPHDLGDPMLLAYTLAWVGHALRTDPASIWDTNSFWPASDSLLFTDTLLGYAPAGLFAVDGTSALIVYNVLYIGSFALAFIGTYALLRQLGARVAGSAVGAAAFAYAPWKLSQAGHLQVLSCGAIALTLAMLARGHGWSMRDGFRPERQRPGWIVAGWLCALWQFSIGAGLGVPFVYLLLFMGGIVGFMWLVKRPRLRWTTLVANGVGGAIFSLGVLWIADKHAVVASAHPEAARDYDYIGWFSPTWQSFIIAPHESWLWGSAHEAARSDLTWPPEQTLLVGFTVLSLAFAGLVWSSWTRGQRIWLALGGAATIALAMGPNFLDNGSWAWGLLYEYVPGFDAIRTPGRLVLYLSLILAVLAAGTLTKLADDADAAAHRARIDPRLRERAPRTVHALLFLPMALVLAEGYTVTELHEPPERPAAVADIDGPALYLPSGGRDTIVQYWSIGEFGDIANGIAAFTPAQQEHLRNLSKGLPAPEAVDALREAGIETVVLVNDWIPGSEWQHLQFAEDPWGVDVEHHDDVVIYRLDGGVVPG